MRLFRKFIRHYNHLLGRYKYPVQIISGGALWFSGDILCQSLVQVADRLSLDKQAPDQQQHAGSKGLTQLEPKTKGYDWHRVLNMTFYGMCFSAPIYAFWYSFLDSLSTRIFSSSFRASKHANATVPVEKLIAKAVSNAHPSTSSTGAALLKANAIASANALANASANANANIKATLSPATKAALQTDLNPAHSRASTRRLWQIIGFKIFADIVVFDPLYLSFFFTVTSKLESKSWQEIKNKLSADFKSTYIIDVIVWFPIQLINFRFVPVMYQALLVQSCNIGWNAFLSFVQHDEKQEPTITTTV